MSDETPETAAAAQSQCLNKELRACITALLEKYFQDMDGHMPCALYQLMLSEFEQPLLATVMHHTRGNQSKAATILGINRTTLRKKLALYGLE